MDKRTLERKSFRAAARTAETWTRFIRTDEVRQISGGIKRMLLCAVLSRGLILGGFAPLGVAMTGAYAAFGKGYTALAGAFFGAILLRGGMSGVTAAAAALLTLVCAQVFDRTAAKGRSWFMPLVSALMMAACSFVLLPAPDQLRPAHVFQFLAACTLTGGLCWCYIQALSPPRARGDLRHPGGLLAVVASLLIAVGDVTIFGAVAPARVLAFAFVLAGAYLGGSTTGTALGVAFGVTMDASIGGGAFLTCVYGLSALLSGAFRTAGKPFFVLSGLLSAGAAGLLGIDHPLFIPTLYESVLAAMVFWLIPQPVWQYARDTLLPARNDTVDTVSRVRRSAGRYATEASEAFYEMYLAMMTGAQTGRAAANEDVHAIFDCAADKVCRKCTICNQCWQRDYISTLSALNDVSIPMLKRGRAEASDFPRHFADRCLHFPELLRTVNEALFSLRERHQYRKRCEENRSLIAQQYAGLTGILRQIGGTLGRDQASLPARERQVRSYASAFGRIDKVAVFRDGAGRLRIELAGEGLENILQERRGFSAGLSAVLSVGLTEPERIADELGTRLMLREQAPFRAIVGIGQRQKQGEKVSGDTARSFVTEGGSACLLLADGMGTGAAAAQDSRTILSLMERFLRAGIPAADALRTVAPAFRLRSDGTRGVTLDALTLDLFTGRGDCLKCGAAPSFVKTQGAVTRLSGGNLPVGLSDEPAADQSVPVRLTHGDLFIMVSDGICDGSDDEWLRTLLRNHSTEGPKELAARLVVTAAERGANDDLTALVVRLENRPPSL